jgi:hypothetical protein
MYPHERSLVKALANKPFVLIGVNSDDDRDEIKKTVKKEEITWRSFWNGGSPMGDISCEWNVMGWPTVYVIDAKGTIRWKGHGDTANIDATIETCLKELDPSFKLEHGDKEKEKDKDKK